MLEAYCTQKTHTDEADFRVHLSYTERQKCRHKTRTECGQEFGWFIERGQILENGDYLLCQNGQTIKVLAATETVSQIESEDRFLLMRAAYHLGNRHVPLQIGPNFLRYLHDHVLDAMVVGLGLEVSCAELPFHPENGAYHGKSLLLINQGHHHHA